MVKSLIVTPLPEARLSVLSVFGKTGQLNQNQHSSYREPQPPCLGGWENNSETAKQSHLPGMFVHKLISFYGIIE